MTDASDHLREVQRKAAGWMDEAELAAALRDNVIGAEAEERMRWKKKGVLRKGKGGSSVQSVRFPTAELNAVRARAEQAGMTTSAYIRACLRPHETITMMTFLSTNATKSWGKLNESWTA